MDEIKKQRHSEGKLPVEHLLTTTYINFELFRSDHKTVVASINFTASVMCSSVSAYYSSI